MNLGLIARNEVARGLAIQSHSFYENMPVDRVLEIIMPFGRNGESATDWYPGSIKAEYDDQLHGLESDVMINFLEGLDIVFTAETPYDWSMTELCKQLKVKLVIQGNPEFYKHGRPKGPPEHQQPTEWWWPTMWRMGMLPAGPLMPCPQPDRPFTPEAHDGPLRVLHTVGKKAWKDRNGTDIFTQAIRLTKEPLEVTMHGIDGELPEIWPQKNVTWFIIPNAVEDRWTAYEHQDVLVLPRRYGGNCLPALEAAACGLAVMMPNHQPNDELAVILTKNNQIRNEVLPCGVTAFADPDPWDIAAQLDRLATDRQALLVHQHHQHLTAPRWENWRPRYLKRMENLCSSTR